ncbi:ROP interactive partner 5 [Rhynchospora pubera]|uniref:ROP interactive partner 5 n=1 Tax=Rhynchospora pubera TaxID=906938 RepID=A0AAV8EIC2_9POAL|nr:ROP interactive partner 5 [Rhynchospora pubera]
MQTPKPSRNGSGSEVPQKPSPATPRSTRGNKSGNDIDTSGGAPARTSSDRSPKVTDRRSPRSPAKDKKRPSKISELESQISGLKDELKKVKDELASSDACKTKAVQEAEATNEQLTAVTAKLEEAQCQLSDFSAAEESRLQELRQISQERDFAWQSELEAMQNQQSADKTEIQVLKQQLETITEAEATHSKLLEESKAELLSLKEELLARAKTIERLQVNVREVEKGQMEAKGESDEQGRQLEIAKTAIEKLQESICLKEAELEASRARVSLLEETVSKLQHVDGNNEAVESSVLHVEMERLKSDLEAAWNVKTELEKKVHLLESEHESKDVELNNLKKLLEEKPETESDVPVPIQVDLETKLMKSITDIAELKASLMDKENELQNLLEENETVKSETSKKETESLKKYEAVVAELELAKAAEQDTRMRLGYVTEEADKSSRRAARVTEQLDAAQAVNSEMEAELRRLRVQSDQWRKAAEAAAAALTGTNNGRLIERSGSLDPDYNSIGGKMLNSPFSDDLEFESPKKKNGGVLRRMSGLWKKSPK